MREEFPILKNGLVYLDNAATTQKPRQVIEAVTAFYTSQNANIHRGLYPLSEEATRLYEEARQKIAAFIGAPPAHLIFTSGTTEAINLVAWSWGLDNLEAGDEILLTPVEHHANIVPWQEVAKRTGAKVIFCGLNDDLTIDLEDVKGKITEKTKLLAITHLSNVLGTITPLEEIIPFAKEQGVTVLVDGAQAPLHLEVEVEALGCDFYAFSGHKMLGPTGIGALYIKDLSLRPAKTGGDMIDDVTFESSAFSEREPRRFEAGTQNLAGVAGLGAAVEYLNKAGKEQIRKNEEELLAYCWDELEKIEGLTLLGPAPSTGKRSAIITFTMSVPPHDVAHLLGERGVCIRAGKHCAHPLHHHLALEEGTNRVSFAPYNTKEEVDALVAGLKEIWRLFT